MIFTMHFNRRIEGMQGTLKFTAIVGLILLLTECKKNSTQATRTTIEYDSLSETTASFLDNIPDTTINLSDMYLDDGENVLSFLQANDPSYLQQYQTTQFNNPLIRGSRPKIIEGGGASTDPQVQRRLFISRMLVAGTYLKFRYHWNFPAGGVSPGGI